MNHFFEWIKGHHKRAIIIVILSALIIIFGIPTIINICFKIPAPCKFLEPEWEASDVLAYYGGVLGFLGTALLSMLALYQNYEVKKESDAKQALLEKIAYEKDMPLLRVKSICCAGNYLCLSVINISDNIAYDFKVSQFTVENAEGKCICKSKKPEIKRTEMFGRSENTIDFKNAGFSEFLGENLGENFKLYFQIKCKDKFSRTHTYMISSNLKDVSELKSLYIVEV